MRSIPTSAAQIEQMKKQAKRLQRNGGGKHADLLNQVAKAAGYDHWHHAKLCFEQASMPKVATLIAECEAIVAAELQGIVKAVMTGPESTVTEPLVLFSTGQGDAWLLDPDENLAACLLWHGVKQHIEIKDDPRGFQIAWDGDFFLVGRMFEVQTAHAEIGKRVIAGYPLELVREVLDKAQSAERRMVDIFMQPDGIPLTPELVEKLAAGGMDRAMLEEGLKEGATYSPSRHSIIGPMVSSDDDI